MTVAVTVAGLFLFGVVAASLFARDPRIAAGGIAVVLLAAWLAALVKLASRATARR